MIKASGRFYIFFYIIFATNIFAQTKYDFNSLANFMLSNSPTLKQQDADILIAAENIKVAQSGNYPNLRVAGNIEYSKKFENLFVPSYIGEDSLTQSSGKYVSLSAYLSYNLFHFGATQYSIESAKYALNAAALSKCIKEKENMLLLLDVYSKTRISNFQLAEYNKIQELYQSLYVFTKRLYESGRLPKTSSMEYAEELANTVTTIASLKEDRANHIAQIAYLSGIQLTENDVLLALNPQNNKKLQTANIPFEKSTTAERAMSLISQKEAELSVSKTNYLPSISIYGRYDMYGSSVNSYNEAFNELERNGYRVGISFSIPIFDGFRQQSEVNIKNIELEKAKLSYEDAKKIYEREQAVVNSQIMLQESRLNGANQSHQMADDINRAGIMLYEAGEADKIATLNSEIEYIKINIILNDAKENLAMNLKKREIINEKEAACVAH